MTQQAAQAAARQPEEGIEPDDLDTKMIVAVGLISTALLVASVLGVTALVEQFRSAETAAKVYQPQEQPNITYGDSDQVIAAQRERLSAAPAAAADSENYTIPITLAKKLVLEELRADRESAANN